MVMHPKANNDKDGGNDPGIRHEGGHLRRDSDVGGGISNDRRPTGTPSSSSSSSSLSNGDDDHVRREAWTVRGQLLLNFHHVISRAINSQEMMRKCTLIGEDMMMGGGTTSTSTSTMSISEQYGAEAAAIVENKSRRDAYVRDRAMAMGLVTLATLRGGRGLASLMRGRGMGAAYRLDSSSPSTTTTTTTPKSPRKIRRYLGIGFDVAASTSIALLSGTFLFMPRPSAYMEDMSKLPLVEGKSVYAEMVCPPLIREYRRVLEKYGGRWPVRGAINTASSDYYYKSAGVNGDVSDGTADALPSQRPLTQEDVSLNVIRKFVENCYRRSQYERALLEDRNAALSLEVNNDEGSTLSRLMRRLSRRRVGDDKSTISERAPKLGTVSIPSPGVPENIPLNLDVEILSMVSDDGQEEGGYGI